MKHIIRLLFIIFAVLIAIGYYFKNSGNHPKGDTLIGIAILLGSFVLMPVFIYHRWKDRKVKDYMLTNDNIQKMRDFNDDKKK
ncbi:hypothetical protein [Aquimarina intermedia]|uniref:Uncharacterized protein n=1 Tax=Aquimarina intermedia TaxID=350814 RepID=A0A5S5CDN1_9FLAO|nr:hypothetical protein [Aquimarina intermedia]TYP76113.1 hypothetical protein BD809_102328 [Aquimarina intermedia]